MGGGYKTPLQPIHLLQKKAARLIAGVHYLATTPNLFYDLNIFLTVFDLYKFQLAILMYNHQSRKLPPIFGDYFLANVTVHDHCTRSQFRLHTVSYKTNRPTTCFTVRLAGPKLWNAINIDTRGKCSLNAFKTAYKKTMN